MDVITDRLFDNKGIPQNWNSPRNLIKTGKEKAEDAFVDYISNKAHKQLLLRNKDFRRKVDDLMRQGLDKETAIESAYSQMIISRFG